MKKTDNLLKEEKLLNMLKSYFLIILFFIYEYIPIIFFSSFGIKYRRWNTTSKTIYMFIMNIIFMLFLTYIYKKDIKKDLKDIKKNFFKIIKIAISYWIIGLIIMIFSNLIISIINNGGLPENEQAVRALLKKAPFFMLFQISIYAPFTEEIIFRKSIKDAINNKYAYIITSGLIFGGVHVISSISNITDLLYIIPYGALGCVFAALYNKTNNIFSTISVHAIHNTSTYILLLIIRLIG